MWANKDKCLNSICVNQSTYESSRPNPLKWICEIQDWWKMVIARRSYLKRQKKKRAAADQTHSLTFTHQPTHLYESISPRSPFLKGDEFHHFDIEFGSDVCWAFVFGDTY